MKLRVLLLVSALLCLTEISATGNVKEVENDAELLKPNTEVENRHGGNYWYGSSSDESHYKKPKHKPKPRPPPLMDTSFECCKDIQAEIVNLQRDLYSFNVKLNDTSRQIVKEKQYLTDLQNLVTRDTTAVKYLDSNVPILDTIQTKLFTVNKPLYAAFTYDLITLIAKIRTY